MSCVVMRAFLVCLLLTLCQCNDRPHLLLLFMDDLGYEDVSYKGAEIPTPTIDKLAQSGIDLTRYYVHPTCTPTRAALMSGRYAWKTGLQSLYTIPPAATAHLPAEFPSLPEVLHDAGYETHMLGKWHLGYAAWNMTPNERGFDTHYGFYQGGQWYYNHTLHGGYDFWENQRLDQSVIGQYSTLLYRDKLEQTLQQYNKEDRTDPTFVYMSFQSIHAPVEAPPDGATDLSVCDGIDSDMRKTFCQQMVLSDYVIAQIIETYQKYGMWDNTLVAFSSDNGGMVATFPSLLGAFTRSCSSNMPYRGGKATMFEGGIRGVSFVSGPLIPTQLRGTSSDIFLHVSDWYATLATMGGATLPSGIDGKDFWNALTKGDDWNRTTLYFNIVDLGVKWSGVIHDGYKYFNGKQMVVGWYPAPPLAPIDNSTDVNVTQWLFDIENDPYERVNLIDTHPAKAAQLERMILDAVRSDDFYRQQNLQQTDAGMAIMTETGVWKPWLGQPITVDIVSDVPMTGV